MENKIFTRSYKAGKAMGEAIIEMVNLMYQNNTAFHFYQGLIKRLQKEVQSRNSKK